MKPRRISHLVPAFFALALLAVPTQSYAKGGLTSCSRFVELAQSDIRSARNSVADREYKTALLLAEQAADRLAKAVSCQIDACRRGAKANSCDGHLDAAAEATRLACKQFLNGDRGDAAESLGTAAGAVFSWLSCVRDSCPSMGTDNEDDDWVLDDEYDWGNGDSEDL